MPNTRLPDSPHWEGHGLGPFRPCASSGLRTIKRSGLRLEHSNLEVPNRAEVLRVAGAKRQPVFGGRGSHEGVARPQAVREGVFLDVHGRPVTNVLGEGKRGKTEGLQEGLRRFMLALVLSTLQQLEYVCSESRRSSSCSTSRAALLFPR